MAGPGIPFYPTLLIPFLGMVFGDLPFLTAWTAWAIGILAGAFFPLFQTGLGRIGTFLLREQDQAPPPPPNVHTATGTGRNGPLRPSPPPQIGPTENPPAQRQEIGNTS
jgi:hypothetical protein